MEENEYQVGQFTFEGKLFPIIHVPSMHYFKLVINGHEARLSYAGKDNVWDMYRAYTPPALRGMGVAAAITQAGLEEARKLGVRIIPSCSYVNWYVSEGEEFNDLL